MKEGILDITQRAIVTEVAGDARLNFMLTRDFKKLVNISIAAGKFILIHPDYELISEAMRLDLFEEDALEDFEVHNWQYEVGETITYDLKEVLFFYILLELNCRIFLCDVGDDLKKMAIESGDTTPDEFIRVRSMHLKEAQLYIHFIKERFNEYGEFREVQQKLNRLTELTI